jgi:hypothetical protein
MMVEKEEPKVEVSFYSLLGVGLVGRVRDKRFNNGI